MQSLKKIHAWAQMKVPLLNKKNIFLSVFFTIIIISGLTINVRSTVLKKSVFKVCK